MMKIRNQKGFTLLEIMLVVLIIGIIALLALPRLLVTRRIAQEQTCLGNQSAIRTHLEAYKWDWGFYPGGTDAETWPQFLIDTRYWPLDDPAPARCPIGSDDGVAPHLGDGSYIYGAATVGGTDTDGNIIEYSLVCPNDHAPESSM
jgi:prepilin-type N-terminal cleavage/methylation domain-containing protein